MVGWWLVGTVGGQSKNAFSSKNSYRCKTSHKSVPITCILENKFCSLFYLISTFFLLFILLSLSLSLSVSVAYLTKLSSYATGL